jgi:hypothetical protein
MVVVLTIGRTHTTIFIVKYLLYNVDIPPCSIDCTVGRWQDINMPVVHRSRMNSVYCFRCVLGNNWTGCEVGYEAVTQSKWVRLYFLGFVLVNNLVIAFIITSF